MSERVLFYYAVDSGREDWWWILISEDGRSLVEHQWKDGEGKVGGDDAIPVDEFMAGDHSAAAKEELKTFQAARSKPSATG